MNEALHELFEKLPDYLGGHLLLAVPAIIGGVLLSVPLGILAHRNATLRGPLMTVASLAQTIPSIALLAIMVAVLGGTIGYRPAFIALLVYSMLPILRNTLTGLQGVDPAMTEAARGVGMTARQTLWQVQLPLALPVILAGIRTATVWVVGITTLSTPVGAPSLGNYIFSGLQLRDWPQVYFGCFFAMALTLVLDRAVRLLEIAATRRRRGPAWFAVAILAIVLAGGLAPALLSAFDSLRSTRSAPGRSAGTSLPPTDPAKRLVGRDYTIGAKGFTEQAILGEWLSQVLEDRGAETKVLGNMGSTILFDALRNDSIDLYIDYTGTIWTTVMKRDKPIRRVPMFVDVAGHLRNEFGILCVGRLGFENTYCLAMRRQQADRLGIRQIGDLPPHLARMTLAGDPEFFGRPEWIRVRDRYNLDGVKTQGMDATFMYQAVRDDQVDLISGFSTDGRLAAYDLTLLEDPEQAFPPYDAIILLSPAASRDSALVRTLLPLLNQIDGDTMRRANLLVDVEGRRISEAARFLLEDPPKDPER